MGDCVTGSWPYDAIPFAVLLVSTPTRKINQLKGRMVVHQPRPPHPFQNHTDARGKASSEPRSFCFEAFALITGPQCHLQMALGL
jgi:hypothetical protein